MKNLVFAILFLVISGISISNVSFTQHLEKINLTEVKSRANYFIKVFHDGFWWIQEYNEDGQLLNEWIDPDQ